MNQTVAQALRTSGWVRRLLVDRARPRMPRRSRFSPALERMEGRALLATLSVGAGKTYATIQAAVNASQTGDTINVFPGTYVEQVTVPDSKDNLTIRSTKIEGATIKAPATLTGEKSVVTDAGATGLTLDGFVISGPAAGIRAGVLVTDGGSANITRNHVTNIQGVPFGVSIIGGIGIAVSDGTATIERNTIDNYEKNGILVDGADATHGPTLALVSRNTVTGVGLNGVVAQNGIQISAGALARVERNDVSGNLFSGPGNAGGGIILVNAGPTSVDNNDVEHNDAGIVLQDTRFASITNNQISDSTEDGIRLTGNSRLNLVSNNDVKRSGLDGIFVEMNATGNLITGNKFKDSGNLDAEDLSSGSGTAGTGNLWINNKGKTDNKGGALVNGKGGHSHRDDHGGGHSHDDDHGDDDDQGDDD